MKKKQKIENQILEELDVIENNYRKMITVIRKNLSVVKEIRDKFSE